MSVPRRFAYALGAAGFQITDRIVVAIAIFYSVGPYLALLPEIADGESERVHLATLMAIVGVVIVGLCLHAVSRTSGPRRARGARERGSGLTSSLEAPRGTESGRGST